MVIDTRVRLVTPDDLRDINSHLAGGGGGGAAPTLWIGDVTVTIDARLDPAVQVEILSALRNHVDALIEQVHDRAAQIRHAGDWGGDAA